MVRWEIISVCTILCFVGGHVTSAGSIDGPNGNTDAQVRSKGPAFPWPHYRLPEAYYPNHYGVFIYPHPENDTFSGVISIDLQTRKLSEWVIMNQHKLNISRIMVQIKNKVWKIKDFVTSDEYQILAIQLPEATSRTYERLSMTIHFMGLMHNDDRFGFYKGYFTGSDGKTKRPMYLTNLLPAFARRMMPCFDEPSFKSKFTIQVVRPSDMISLSNMPLAKSVQFTDKLFIDKFKTSVKMSPHLLAIVICDFVPNSANTAKGTKISLHVPNEFVNQTKVALELSVFITQHLENLFQIPYPLPKLDLTISNDYNNYAMEHWGLCIFTANSKALYIDSDLSSSFPENQMKVHVLVNQIVHQWIGNLITAKFWNDIWLTEGVAEFFATYVLNKLYPEWNSTKTVVTAFKNYHMNVDSDPDTRPIRYDVEKPAEYRNLFSGQMSFKGSMMANFIMNAIGEDKFLNAFREYLAKYSFKNVEEKDFLGVLNKHAPLSKYHPLSVYIETFTNQSGIPLLDVREIGNGLFEISQRQFFNNVSLMKKPSNKTWNVLATVRFDSGETKYLGLWKNSSVYKLNLKSSSYKWFKLNVNNAGYYRVNYGDKNWGALFKQLIENKDVFSPLDRYGLFSDMFSAVNHKTISLPKVFKFLNDYAGKETDRRCLYFLTYEVGGIGKHLHSTLLFEIYESYVKHVLQNVDRLFDWSLVLSDRYNEWGSGVALSTVSYFNLGQFRKDAFEIFYTFSFRNASNKVLEEQRSVICQEALLYDQTISHMIYQLYSKAKSAQEKQDYFTCLLFSKDTSLVYELLDTVKNDSTIIYNAALYSTAFLFSTNGLKTYWTYYQEKFDDHFTNSTDEFAQFAYPLRYFNTEEQFNQVAEFFASKSIDEKQADQVIKILEKIKSNIESTNYVVNAFKTYLNM